MRARGWWVFGLGIATVSAGWAAPGASGQITWEAIRLHPGGAYASEANGADGPFQAGTVTFSGQGGRPVLWEGSSNAWTDLTPSWVLGGSINGRGTACRSGSLRRLRKPPTRSCGEGPQIHSPISDLQDRPGQRCSARTVFFMWARRTSVASVTPTCGWVKKTGSISIHTSLRSSGFRKHAMCTPMERRSM